MPPLPLTLSRRSPLCERRDFGSRWGCGLQWGYGSRWHFRSRWHFGSRWHFDSGRRRANAVEPIAREEKERALLRVLYPRARGSEVGDRLV